MFKQTFRKIAAFLGLAAAAHHHAPAKQSQSFDMALPKFTHRAPEAKWRGGSGRRPESWHRLRRKLAQRARELRDANNALLAIYWRKRILEANKWADPSAFMPKVRWVKGGGTRVGGKYD